MKKLKKILIILLFVISCLAFKIDKIYASGNRLHFIGGSSGHSATLIEATYKDDDNKAKTHYALIDLGKESDYAYIKKYLKDRKIKISFLLITHADSDHYGGKIDASTIKKLVTDGLTRNDFYVFMKEKTSVEQKLANNIREKEMTVKNPSDILGASYIENEFAPLNLKLYNTGLYNINDVTYLDNIKGSPENAQSIVIHVTGAKHSAALFGDMSYYGARIIAQNIGNVSIYTAFHHGVSCKISGNNCSEKWKNDSNGNIGTASTAKIVAGYLAPKYTIFSNKGKRTKNFSNIDNLGIKYYHRVETIKKKKKQVISRVTKRINIVYDLNSGGITTSNSTK